MVEKHQSENWLGRRRDENQFHQDQEKWYSSGASSGESSTATTMVENKSVGRPFGKIVVCRRVHLFSWISREGWERETKMNLQRNCPRGILILRQSLLGGWILESKRLPEHKPYNHAIDLKPETPEMIWSKNYLMPINDQEELDQFLEEHLHKGYTIPSKSSQFPNFCNILWLF
jgi:hypothetical protein